MNWGISSSSGREFLLVNLLSCHEDRDGEVFFASHVEIVGKFWNRFTKKIEGDYVEDFSVKLHQVRIYKNKLESLLESLTAWFENPSRITIDLGARYEKFRITIGPIDEIISSETHPVFVIDCSLGGFGYGKCAFVVDQSCINLLKEELSAALEADWSCNNLGQL